MSAYPNVQFLTSANALSQFPPDTEAEVAVAGRSNAGKSSAINAITQRKGLARTSKTPGATRLVNFFVLRPGARLVDLPGYGFAAVSPDMRRHWGSLIGGYFKKRESLRGVLVVMDIRHPLTQHDLDMLALAQGAGVPVHILLTKADKLGGNAGRQTLAQVRRAITGMPGVSAQLFSAFSGAGVGEGRAAMERLLAMPRSKDAPVGLGPTGAS